MKYIYSQILHIYSTIFIGILFVFLLFFFLITNTQTFSNVNVRNFKPTLPDSISPFDRPLTHKSFFNIVYFSLISLRPSGRFETNTRLCLSMSDYHPESWNPSWSVETLLVGLQSFMYEENNTAIGSVK